MHAQQLPNALQLMCTTTRIAQLRCLGSLDELAARIKALRREAPADWQAWMPLTYQYQAFCGAGRLKALANDRCIAAAGAKCFVSTPWALLCDGSGSA